MSSKWDKIIKCIEDADNIVILTHTNMDGDAMGSASALCCALRSLGKTCYILLEDDIPSYLDILHSHEDFYVKELPFKPDLAIAVDCGDSSRIEKRIDVYNSANKTICIDHHMQHDGFADESVVEPDIAATGILIYELLKEMGIALNKEIAEDLYAAISTDTGSFKFSNTDSRVHTVIADLYSYDIEASKLCNAIYATYPLCQLKLEGIALDHCKVFANGKAAISYLTKEDMKSVGASYEHCDTSIDRIRCIEGVEVAAVLKENDEGQFKTSLRAKEYADVNSVARAFNGGGHLRAAGCTFDTDLKTAIELLEKEIEKVV